MNRNLNNRALAVSQTIYARLLRAYPPAHREEYGSAMAQLFRDQCRDAWNEAHGWGVVKLWLRVLPDLVKTSIIERLAALTERKSMADKINSLVQPRLIFRNVFVVVFLITVLVSVTITYILPESYASTATIKVDSDHPTANYDPFFIQTQFEIIQSQLVLQPAMDKLKLKDVWSKKYFNGEKLKDAEALEILKGRLGLRPIRNTQLFSITSYSEDKNEAAQIANAVAESYRDYRARLLSESAVNSLRVLEQQYQAEEASIQQVQGDADTLRQSYKLSDADAESFAESQQLYQKNLAEGERTYQQQVFQLRELEKLDKKQLRETLPAVVPDTALSGLLDKFHEAERQYTTLTIDFPPGNAAVLRVQSQIEILNRQVDERVIGILAGLSLQTKVKREELGTLAARYEMVKAAKPYWDKMAILQKMAEAHTLLATKIQSVQATMVLPMTTAVQITDTAEPGRAPVKPNKTLNITLGVVGGIFMAGVVGGGAAFIALINRRRKQNPNTIA